MATGIKSYGYLTPKLVASFELPDDYRAMKIATVGGNQAWCLIFDLPMVVLVDNTGHVYQTAYAVKKMRKIREKNTTGYMLEEAKRKELAGEAIAADDKGNCFIITSKHFRAGIKHVSQSGAVSTVISGLQRFMTVQGIAYVPESKGKGKILVGYHARGLQSLKWSNTFLSQLTSPRASELFFYESMCPVSVAVDKNSDLLCVGELSTKVYIINREGKKISEFIPEEKDKFYQDSVAFDHTGCIIVLNSCRFKNSINSVYRLSPEGELLQTIFPEIDKTSEMCADCKKLKVPKCKECKEKVQIVTIDMDGDHLWVSRLSGEVEIYRLL